MSRGQREWREQVRIREHVNGTETKVGDFNGHEDLADKDNSVCKTLTEAGIL